MFWVICFQNAALPQLFWSESWIHPWSPWDWKPKKASQGFFTARLLKHRLYWHIGKNFKDVRSFFLKRTNFASRKKGSWFGNPFMSRKLTTTKNKRDGTGHRIYIYIYTWKSRQQVNKIQLQSAATFFEFSGCQSLLNWHWFWIKSLSIQT